MRSRWLAVKVGSIGLVALASAGLLSLMASWWMTPLYQATAKANSDSGVDRLAPAVFGANGIVPIGYAAFGFALGLAFGVLIRRSIPAMAATLAVFAGIQVAWPRWIRPHLMSPLHATAPLNLSKIDELAIDTQRHMYVQASASRPGAWVLANQTIDPAGHLFTGPATKACLNQGIQGVQRLRGQAAPPPGPHLPAGQPVLGLPVVRDRDLPGPRPRAGLVLLLAGQPPPLLTADLAWPVRVGSPRRDRPGCC